MIRRLVLLLLLGVGGCAQVIDRPDDGRLPQGRDGTLVLSITANTGEIKRFDTLLLAPESGTGPSFQLRSVDLDAGRDTALFVAPLPAGRYVIRQLSWHYYRGVRSLAPKTSATYPGVIDIAAGRCNDLGRVVVTAVGPHVWIGRSRRQTDSDALLRRVLPARAEALIALRRDGWRDPPQAGDGAEAHALAHPVGVQALVELPDQSVAAASRSGAVLLRDPAAHWRVLDTGQLEALRWVSEGPDGARPQIVAAGEFDALRVVKAGGRVRDVDTHSLPLGDLVFVSELPDTSWVVILENRDQYRFYRTPQLAQPQWSPIGSQPRGSSEWEGPDHLWAWRTERGFACLGSDGTLRDYDIATDRWQTSTLPVADRVEQVSVSPGGFVSAVTSGWADVGGLLSKVWVSDDAGRHWTSVSVPARPVDGAVQRLSDGRWLLASDHVLYQSEDGGLSWGRREGSLDPGDRLYATATAGVFRVNDRLAAVTRIGHSGDEGGWIEEWSSLDAAPDGAAPLSDLRNLRTR